MRVQFPLAPPNPGVIIRMTYVKLTTFTTDYDSDIHICRAETGKKKRRSYHDGDQLLFKHKDELRVEFPDGHQTTGVVEVESRTYSDSYHESSYEVTHFNLFVNLHGVSLSIPLEAVAVHEHDLPKTKAMVDAEKEERRRAMPSTKDFVKSILPASFDQIVNAGLRLGEFSYHETELRAAVHDLRARGEIVLQDDRSFALV